MSCIYADRPYTGRIPTCEAGYFNCPNNHTCEGYAEYKPPTNADRIRAMSDVELANFIGAVATKDWGFRSLYGGYSAALDWLRQPADKAGEPR